MNKKIIVTTSWDDGRKQDLRILELLDKYNLKGTFYICPNEIDVPELKGHMALSPDEIKQISKTQEIGAHTLSHPNLTKLPLNEVESEIKSSKQRLEGILGKEIDMFCYPSGQYNNRIISLVRQAGFKGARTIKRFSLDFSKDPFELSTTMSVTPQNKKRKQDTAFLKRYLFYYNIRIGTILKVFLFLNKSINLTALCIFFLLY